MNNTEIANIFDEISILLELKDENPFKISAYRNSARIIRGLNKDITTLIKSGEINQFKGFGKSTIEKVNELLETGNLQYYSDLKSSIPEGLFELLKIKGLGSKKIKKLWDILNITTLGELEYACKENRLLKLEGFGLKTQKNILDGIEFVKRSKGKFLINVVLQDTDDIINEFKSIKEIIRLSPVNKIRRGAEVYESIEILISTLEFDKVIKQISILKVIKSFDKADQNNLHAYSKSNIPVKIFLCDDFEFAQYLHALTGSENYLHKLYDNIKEENIFFRNNSFYKNSKKISLKNEEDFFKFFKLQYIPPELREGTDEIEAAKNGKIPKLLEMNDIKGTLHVHTTYSDGFNTIEEMALTAQDMGFEYIGICDHSKTAVYANGLKEDDIIRQSEEIDKLNKKLTKIIISKGIESDILANGDLDYSEEVLQRFDFIVASIHFNFSLGMDEMTERILKAVKNKYTTILGHPTGRLLLSRETYALDIKRIIDACIKNNVAIELNSDEHRLDLSWIILKEAIHKGVKISINTDAHHISSLKKIKYGLMMARKASATKKDVINTFNIDDFLSFAAKKKN